MAPDGAGKDAVALVAAAFSYSPVQNLCYLYRVAYLLPTRVLRSQFFHFLRLLTPNLHFLIFGNKKSRSP